MNANEPDWMVGLREYAEENPTDSLGPALAQLLAEYDLLWQAAGPVTRKAVRAKRSGEFR